MRTPYKSLFENSESTNSFNSKYYFKEDINKYTQKSIKLWELLFFKYNKDPKVQADKWANYTIEKVVRIFNNIFDRKLIVTPTTYGYPIVTAENGNDLFIGAVGYFIHDFLHEALNPNIVSKFALQRHEPNSRFYSLEENFDEYVIVKFQKNSGTVPFNPINILIEKYVAPTDRWHGWEVDEEGRLISKPKDPTQSNLYIVNTPSIQKELATIRTHPGLKQLIEKVLSSKGYHNKDGNVYRRIAERFDTFYKASSSVFERPLVEKFMRFDRQVYDLLKRFQAEN